MVRFEARKFLTRVLLSAGLVGAVTGCQEAAPTADVQEVPMTDSNNSESETPQDLAMNVGYEYIKKMKEWPDPDFHFEVLRTEGTDDAPIVVLDAVHHDDLKADKGGAKSVQLHVDVNERSVVKELAYQ